MYILLIFYYVEMILICNMVVGACVVASLLILSIDSSFKVNEKSNVGKCASDTSVNSTKGLHDSLSLSLSLPLSKWPHSK